MTFWFEFEGNGATWSFGTPVNGASGLPNAQGRQIGSANNSFAQTIGSSQPATPLDLTWAILHTFRRPKTCYSYSSSAIHKNSFIGVTLNWWTILTMLASFLRSLVLLKHNFQIQVKLYGQTPTSGLSNTRLFNDPSNSIPSTLKPQLSYHRSKISNLKMHRSQPLMIFFLQLLDFQVGLTSIGMAVRVGWVSYQDQVNPKQATLMNFHRSVEMATMRRGMTPEEV